MLATAREYASLLARAFDGAITVDGERIVAHKSGMLLVRTPPQPRPGAPTMPLDQDNNWSDV
jgi:hypothetical protein